MTFFDDALSSGEASSGPELLHARPRGRSAQPPRDWVIPTVLPSGQRLASSDSAVVCLDALHCWPDGVGLSVRSLNRYAGGLPGVPPGLRAPRREGLHVGVGLADGRRAVYVDGGRHSAQLGRLRGEGDPVLLTSAGSTWGQFHRMLELYLTPLPPEGPLALVVQWLEHEIEETRVDLDSAAIRAEAARVADVWPDLPAAPTEGGSGWTAVRIGGASSGASSGTAVRPPAAPLRAGADDGRAGPCDSFRMRPQDSPEQHAEQVRLAEERVAQLEALDLALGRWREVVDAIASAADRADAVEALRHLLGVDERAAHSIVQLQWARLTRDTVAQVRQELAAVRGELDDLRG